MIEQVSDTVLAPTVDDLVTYAHGGPAITASPVGAVGVDPTHEHPIADNRLIGVIAFAALGDGYVWACLLTGNGGVVDSRREALEALLSEALTEYPITDRRPAP